MYTSLFARLPFLIPELDLWITDTPPRGLGWTARGRLEIEVKGQVVLLDLWDMDLGQHLGVIVPLVEA